MVVDTRMNLSKYTDNGQDFKPEVIITSWLRMQYVVKIPDNIGNDDNDNTTIENDSVHSYEV